MTYNSSGINPSTVTVCICVHCSKQFSALSLCLSFFCFFSVTFSFTLSSDFHFLALFCFLSCLFLFSFFFLSFHAYFHACFIPRSLSLCVLLLFRLCAVLFTACKLSVSVYAATSTPPFWATFFFALNFLSFSVHVCSLVMNSFLFIASMSHHLDKLGLFM